MLNKLRLFLIAVLIAAFAGSVTAFCACSTDEPYYGTYYSGSSDDSATITINGDALYMGSQVDLYSTKYQYKYEDGRIYLDFGGSIGYYPSYTLYEDNNVLCMDMLKNLGLTAKPYCRDGYFNDTLGIMEGGSLVTVYDFSSSGKYSCISVDSATGHMGTYALNDGVLTLNKTTLITQSGYVNINEEKIYLYIDAEFNFYSVAFIKNPEQFEEGGSGVSDPVTPPEGGDEGGGQETPEPTPEPTPQTYTLNYTAGEGGRIVGTATQTVEEGGSGDSVIAIAIAGYEFIGWSDGVTAAERTDTNVTEDITVTAQFEEIPEYTLTYSATDGGYIDGENVQTVEEGESGSTVTAVANEGYEFIGWSDGVTTAERTDTNVTEDITVTAQFELTNTTQFAGGSGSQANPYKISTIEHLNNISLYPNAHYILISDITLPQVQEGQSNFMPLFDDETMFNGSLNGNGKTIYNLTICNTDTFYTGLFACIGADSNVTDLTLEDANLQGTNYIGGIAGYAFGAVTDCTVSGKITYIPQNDYNVFLGGIAGRAESTVDGCSSEAAIVAENVAGTVYAGGIVGYYAYDMRNVETAISVTSDSDITLTANDYAYAGGAFAYVDETFKVVNSYSTDNVTVTSNYSYVGGFVGHSGGSSHYTSCYSTGNVTVTSNYSYVGGFSGYSGTVSHQYTGCYSTGNVTLTSKYWANVGGFVGYGGGSSFHYANCFSSGKVAVTFGSEANIGGLVGSSGNSCKISNSYTTSKITFEGEADEKNIGALVGESDSITITNTHWLYYADSGVEYAVGYNSDMGIPTSIGSTKHSEVEDFYTLADILNEGLETPVWQNEGANSLPTLID